MKSISLRCWLASACVLVSASSLRADEPAFTPTSPPSLRVHVSAGLLAGPSAGRMIDVRAADLSFDPPESREFETSNVHVGTPTAVPDFSPYWTGWNGWPGNDLLHLTPRYQDGTIILGGFFPTFRAATLQVTSIEGPTAQRRAADYVYDPDWGVVANKDGHLKGAVHVRAKGVMQRLDLIQVSAADGALSVKRGKQEMVAPELPEPDAGCIALAGIYIAPWPAALNPHYDADRAPMQGATEYAISEHEIAPIHPLPATAPIYPERIARTLAKLRHTAAGTADDHPDKVRIAFMGDSITLGAEATLWYQSERAYGPKDMTYRGRFVHALRERFPKVTVTPVEAYKGGAGIELAVADIDHLLADSRPDLVVIAFGGNDINGRAGGEPHTPVDKFREQLELLTDKVHAAGGDVLLVTCFPINPWLENGSAQRQPTYNAALKEAAEAKGAAVADVYTEYNHLGSHGVPPWSTLHNWINHPDDRGHAVYADMLLSFFPAE